MNEEIDARLARLTRSEQERAFLLKQAMREVLEERSDERKELVKEAISEWLNDKYAAFGRWSLAGIGAAALALLAWFLLVKAGWRPPL